MTEELEQKNPFDNDPEVIAEKKRNVLDHLKMERWMARLNFVVFAMKNLKAEMVSAVSVVGTGVLGYYQVRKWIITGHAEVKALTKQEILSPRAPESTSIEGVGFGSGRGGSGKAVMSESSMKNAAKQYYKRESKIAKQRTTEAYSATTGKPVEVMAMPAMPVVNPLADIMNYALAASVVVAFLSSKIAWGKKSQTLGSAVNLLFKRKVDQKEV